jgi:hypothetical protein
MSKYTYYTPVEQLTKQDVFKENVKSVLLAIAIGVGSAILVVYQLSK